MSVLDLPPLSLYIHIPWCAQKCPYCDFNSHAVRGNLDEGIYVDALLADLDGELFQVQDRALHSIFIGGGTPSLFSGSAIAKLLAGIRQRITCPTEMEITLEANPGTLEAGRFEAYHAAGVNRLSIGVQSFDAGCLKRLGRIHGPDEATATMAAAQSAGFENINLDLMFGLPNQKISQARADLETAIGLNPGHISYYQLTLEPDTPFYNSPPALPVEEAVWDMQLQGQALLRDGGYAKYEISAYARPEWQCRHNLNYWTFGDYLGIGAGAHGKSTSPTGLITRRWKIAEPSVYLAGSGSGLYEQKTLDSEEIKLEFMMNALRLQQGFSTDLFEARTGLSFVELKETVSAAIQRGLLESEGGILRPTSLGQQFLNDLLAQFICSHSSA